MAVREPPIRTITTSWKVNELASCYDDALATAAAGRRRRRRTRVDNERNNGPQYMAGVRAALATAGRSV